MFKIDLQFPFSVVVARYQALIEFLPIWVVLVGVVISQIPLTSTLEGHRSHQGASAELCADWSCTLWIEGKMVSICYVFLFTPSVIARRE